MPSKVRKNRNPENWHRCALTECMSILGSAWTTNVIWSLRDGPRRFCELLSDIPRISPKVLTTRLRELEQRGVLQREPRSTTPPTIAYSLTHVGLQLIPAIEGIVAVGHKVTVHEGGKVLSVNEDLRFEATS